MRLSVRDGIAGLLTLGLLVPYIGYLAWGEMPFIEDARGMSATALVLGAAAFLTAGRITVSSMVGKIEASFAVVTLALGITAFAFAETATAEALLAIFVVAVVGVRAVQLLHHAGFLGEHFTPTALPR
jgi:hypothetical protein